MLLTATIEQTFDYPERMKYLAAGDTFISKGVPSLSYARDVRQPYGWIKESGTPPCRHLDVILMADAAYRLGDEVPVRIIGVFARNDGDNKLVAVPRDRPVTDFSQLSAEEKADMHRLYPIEDLGEGWFGRDRAEEIVRAFFAEKKDKTIITVQHTESLHHVNGMIGAWGDWPLTPRGHHQAFAIGEWLASREDGLAGWKLYTSDLTRARETAEEIVRTCPLEITQTAVLREVNAGQGNGRTREWYALHKHPEPCGYDPDHRPFDDAESDRDLWLRLYPFCQQLLAREDEHILIVSHGTALSFLQAQLMGDSFSQRAFRRMSGSAGAVSKLEIDRFGRVTIRYLNQIVHDSEG